VEKGLEPHPCKPIFHGLDGVRLLAEKLGQGLPNARFTHDVRLVVGRMGSLKWSGEGENGNYVNDGADSS
jgi:hypothetical protein